MITRREFVGWLVESLVDSLVRNSRCDFSKTIRLIFMKFGADVQQRCHISLLTYQLLKVKVKVQGQNHLIENLQTVIA